MNRVHGKTKWERDESSFYWNINLSSSISSYQLNEYTLFSCQILLCISVYKMVTIELSGNTQFSQCLFRNYLRNAVLKYSKYNNDKNNKMTLLKLSWFKYKVDQKRQSHWLVLKKTSKKTKTDFLKVQRSTASWA